MAELRTQRGGLGLVALLAVAVVAAPATAAPASPSAITFEMGPTVAPLSIVDTTSTHSGPVGIGVKARTTPKGLTSMTFPGWTSVTSAGAMTGPLDTSRSYAHVTPADPHTFNPGTGSFAVGVRFSATLVGGTTYPTPRPGHESSFNVVQKGRVASGDGMWKLELIGSGTRQGAVHCVMRDEDGTAVDVDSAGRGGQPRRVVESAAWFDVRCVLDRAKGVLTLSMTSAKVTTVISTPLSQPTAPGVDGVLGNVDPDQSWSDGNLLSVARKPGSVDPEDAFAGKIDRVVITGPW